MSITREQLNQTESQTYQFRLLALLLVAFLIYWFFPPDVHIWPVVTVALGYLVYTVGLHHFVLRRYFHPYMVFAIMAADWLLATFSLHVLGVASAAFLLFPLLVGYHAMYLGLAGSLTSATVASFISLGLSAQRWDPAALSTVAFRIPLLYIIAAIAGYLARQRSHEHDARLALQEALRTEQKARELLGVVQEMRREPDKVLQHVASSAVRATGARQGLIMLKERASHDLHVRAAYAPGTEAPVNGLAGIVEPLAGHWLESAAADTGAVVLSTGQLPEWARRLPEASPVIGIPLISGSHRLGVMYLIANGSAPEETRRIADYIAPLVSACVVEARRYDNVEREAGDLLRGLQTSVERMVHVHEAQSRRPIARGPLVLNPAKEQALLDGRPLALSSTEFEVFYYLAERAGQTVNQATLLREVWGDEGVARSNIVDVCIYRLRRKLSRYPSGKDLITTARGAGYKLSTG